MTVLKDVALKIQSKFNRFDPLSDGPPLQFAQPSSHPIFIVGAPRSGSTLLYQLLLKHTHVTYISNLMSLMPIRMILIAKHTSRFHKFKDLKESDLGYLSGLFSPSEAGSIQRKWFGAQSTAAISAKVRNTIVLLTNPSSAPFISKNLMNSLRLERINQILPEARYVFVRRNPLFNAQSLLLSRKKVFGTVNQWWSAKPSGYEEVTRLDPEYQVVWQVLEIEKTITRFFDKYSTQNIEISYEELCRNPQKSIERIVTQFDLKSKPDVAFDNLSIRNSIEISQEAWSKIKHWHDKLL